MLVRRCPQRLLQMLLVVMALAVGAAAGTAHAVPSFDSLSGNFTFSDFVVTPPDYDDVNITFQATNDGFDIIMSNDSMRVGANQSRDLTVQYTITSNVGPIETAMLAFDAAASGNGAFATVAEDYFSQPGSVLVPPGLTVFTSDGGSLFFTSQSVGGATVLTVRKDIQVANFGGQFAEITRVSQSYGLRGPAPIPEPSAAVLFAVGAIAVATRLRRPTTRH